MMLSNHLMLCHPFSFASVFPNIKVFYNESAIPIKWQSIGASVSLFPMNIQGWSPLGLTGLISLLSKGLLKLFASTTIPKHQFSSVYPSIWFNSHICTWLLCIYGQTEWYLYFLICCLGLSYLSLQGASFNFIAASHYSQWFWSPRK